MFELMCLFTKLHMSRKLRQLANNMDNIIIFIKPVKTRLGKYLSSGTIPLRLMRVQKKVKYQICLFSFCMHFIL